MSQNSAPPGDELASQEDLPATDHAKDQILRYAGYLSDDFAGEDGYSCEGEYFIESNSDAELVSGSDDRAALYGVPDYADEPEPPNPTQVADQTALFQSFSSRGIKPESRVHSPDRYGAIEEHHVCKSWSKRALPPEHCFCASPL